MFQNNLVELCTPNDLGNLNLSNTDKVVEFIPWFANPDLLLQDFVEGFKKMGIGTIFRKKWELVSNFGKMGIATKFLEKWELVPNLGKMGIATKFLEK